MRKCDLRLWAAWDPVIGRIEISSESQSACRKVIDLFSRNGRTLQLLRFDLSPLYYDDPISSPPQGYALAGAVLRPVAGVVKNTKHKTHNTR